LQPSSKILAKSGMMRNGKLYQHETLVPAISGKESGSLPTPNARDHKDGFSSREKVEAWAANKTVEVLTTVCVKKHPVHTLPTPTTFDSGQPLPPRKKNPSGGQKPPLVSVIGGKLNPQFVEWMMGYPEDWTKVELKELNNSETQSSQLSLRLLEEG
jgi:hypothetical protein